MNLQDGTLYADGQPVGTVKSIEIEAAPAPQQEYKRWPEPEPEPSPAEMSPAAYRRKFGHHKPTNLAVGIALALRT